VKALRLVVLAAALVPAGTLVPARAAPIERTWSDPQGGSFNDSANWAGGVVPGNGDVALFDYSGRESYAVFFERSTAFWGLKVGDEDVAFDLRGQQVTVQGKDPSGGAAFGFAAGDRAAVRIGGGTMTTSGAGLAGPADSAAIVILAGPASRWNAGAFMAGRRGTGRVEVAGGSLLTSQAVGVLGEMASSQGEVLVTGQGSRWTAAGLSVGKAGAGRLEVAAGGVLTTSSSTTIGEQSSSRGEVLLTGPGSRWEAAAVYLGGTPSSLMPRPDAQGTLSVLDGAVFSGSIQAGYATGGTGRVVVSGVNGTNRSTLQLYNATIGERGNGTLLVQNGARAEFGTAEIGRYNGTVSEVVVGGSGGFKAELNVAEELHIGSFSTAPGPSYTGALTVNAGGAVTARSMRIGADAAGTGTVTVNGGDVRGSAWVIAGQMNLNAGSFRGWVTLGGPRGTPATFTQTGGTVAAVRPDGTEAPSLVSVGAIVFDGTHTPGTYNLHGGALRATVHNNSRGTFNHTGGTLDGTVENLGAYVVSSPPAGGAGAPTFTGTFNNYGTVRVTDATARFDGAFRGSGTFFSEGGRVHFTVYNTGPTSVVIADEATEFVVSGDFWTNSAMAERWDTSRAQLHFSGQQQGELPYYLQISGVDRGATYEGYRQNFAWGALHVDAGKELRLISPGAGRAIYVRDLLLDGGVDQIGSITSTSTPVNLYYDANSPANAYLGGRTYHAPGAEILPVPEPGTAMLVLPGVWLLTRRHRAGTAGKPAR
jgi:T5SS/PEP-CTERM-associated repeat protein